MKTSLPFNTGPVRTPEHGTLNGQTGRSGASGKGRGPSGSLDFKLLFADIKPTAVFRNMSGSPRSEGDAARTLARQQEQQRLEKQRQAQRPREQDQIGLHAPDPQRSPAAASTTRGQDSASAPARKEAISRPQREPRPPSPAPAAAAPAQPPTGGPESATDDDQQATPRPVAATATAARTEADTPAPAAATAPQAGQNDAAAVTGDTHPASAPGAAVHGAAAAPTLSSGAADAPGTASDTAGLPAEVVALAGALKDVAEQAPLPVSDAEAARLGREAGLSDVAADAQASSLALHGPAALSQIGQDADTPTARTPQAMLTARADDGTAADAVLPQALMHGAARPAARTPNPAMMPAVDAPPRAASGSIVTGTSSTPLPDSPLPTAQALSMQEMGAQPGSAGAVRGEGQVFSLGVALPAAGSHSPVRTDGSPLLASRIDSPVNSQEFREQFARQVAGLTVQGQDRAEIRLTPAELGPIRIRLALSADDAMLDISAAHAATRTAIEASMPTLRQMLAEQGLRLADYRMDQGNNPSFLSQNRQSGQEHSSGMQHPASAFGQNAGQGGEGRRDPADSSHAQGRSATHERSTVAITPASGSRRNTGATVDGRLDLFA